jgi:hypothetical protein
MDPSPEEVEFFIEIKGKLEEIQDIVEKYGYRERFVSAYAFGVEQSNTEKSIKIATMAGMNVSGLEELEVILSHIIDQYEDAELDSSDIDFWIN